MYKKLIALSCCFFMPMVSAFAATPTAFLEHSQIIATGKQVRIYRAPTRDASGKIKYYDLTITLEILDNGNPDPLSTKTASVLSPSVSANKFVPGTYKDPTGDITCLVSAATLVGGRMQGAISCKAASNGAVLSASWVNGLIAGHPFQLDLLAAGIDKIPGYQNFSWGKLGYTHYPYFGCMDTGGIVSATQIGDSIQLSGYDDSNIQQCGVTLMKQPK